jgi:3-isopropylmalate/(R)-2-methylmalate dehydratase small subunit
MTPLIHLDAIALPLLRENIDTDAIIPSREMRSVGKTGLADGLFAGWRYREIGGRDPDPAFVLNDPRYRGAQILIGGANFGCGSSREHAVWALAEYGFRAIVAPSFSPIFWANCIRNGVAPVILPVPAVIRLAELAGLADPVRLEIDFSAMAVRAGGQSWGFDLEPEARTMLMEGLDAIELTFKRAGEIAAFRAADAGRRPWAYPKAKLP